MTVGVSNACVYGSVYHRGRWGLILQVFLLVKMKSLLRKFYGRHHDSVSRYRITVTQMTTDISTCRKHFPVLCSFMTYRWVCNQSNTTDATSGAGTVYPSEAIEFTPGFQWDLCCSIFSFMYFVDSCLSFKLVVLFLLAIVLSVLLIYKF